MMLATADTLQRRIKCPATDMFSLQPSRHISTLPDLLSRPARSTSAVSSSDLSREEPALQIDRPRRATADVEIDRDDPVDCSDDRVAALEHAAAATADRDHPFRIGGCAQVRSSATFLLSVTGPVTRPRRHGAATMHSLRRRDDIGTRLTCDSPDGSCQQYCCCEAWWRPPPAR
jgi:hypothetical protein